MSKNNVLMSVRPAAAKVLFAPLLVIRTLLAGALAMASPAAISANAVYPTTLPLPSKVAQVVGGDMVAQPPRIPFTVESPEPVRLTSVLKDTDAAGLRVTAPLRLTGTPLLIAMTLW